MVVPVENILRGSTVQLLFEKVSAGVYLEIFAATFAQRRRTTSSRDKIISLLCALYFLLCFIILFYFIFITLFYFTVIDICSLIEIYGL